MIDIDPTSPVTFIDVAEHTRKNKTLYKVLNWMLREWPQEKLGEEFKSFQNKQFKLSTIKGCLLSGERVVVPQKLRKQVLETLHVRHPGIVRMKALAWSYIWWPNLDQDITEWVATCRPCQVTRPASTQIPVQECEVPKGPWSRIHIDFARPITGQTFLIMVDAYSKWLEVVTMSTTTMEATIRALWRIFATHSLPDMLVSDNGPQLTAKAMETFLVEQGI